MSDEITDQPEGATPIDDISGLFAHGEIIRMHGTSPEAANLGESAGIAKDRRASIKTWIVSREDLILSKLVWAKEADSELQRRDVGMLLDQTMDRTYVDQWAARLGVEELLAEIAG